MNETPDLLDTAYEYAGFQAAGSFQAALSGLSIPLIFALAGVAYRIFRVAEDGALRPVTFHLMAMLLVAWLASARSSDASALPHLRAPRALGMIDSAADSVVRRAIEGIDKDFLTRPFEWERLALLTRLSMLQDPQLVSEVRLFLEECVPAAMVRRGTSPPAGARRNPLADDSGLSYGKLVDASGRSCEAVRRTLSEAVRREVATDPHHREVVAALAAYDGGETHELEVSYVDRLIRNLWLQPEAAESELAAATRSVGAYRWLDVDRRTMRFPFDGGRDVNTVYDLFMFSSALVAEVGTGIYAEVTQWLSDATESKQRFYLITTHAPHLYGLTVMLLMSFLPVATLYALLPGKWTALLQYCKIYFSVKLWPFGWALLTAFTDRRPSALALADAASDLRAPIEHALRIGETPNLFLTVSLMYVVVPAAAFMIVQLVSQATSLPFQSMMPRPAGGNPAGAAAQAASALAA